MSEFHLWTILSNPHCTSDILSKPEERERLEINNGKLVIIHLDLLDEKARNNHQSERWKMAFIPVSIMRIPKQVFEKSFYRVELWLTVSWMFRFVAAKKNISASTQKIKKMPQLELFNNLHLRDKRADLKYSDNIYASWLHFMTPKLSLCFFCPVYDGFFFSLVLSSRSHPK
jgi:hypothetical protein